jgi:catechol 2,3-dioxygenase-like lactoylglutathione lyase family enzyme
MPLLGFSHYNLRASRDTLDALRDFYVNVVGLRQGDRPPFRHYGYWLYAGDEAVLHLSEVNPGEVRHTQVSGTFDHVAFACTGAAQFEAHLERLGVQYRRDVVPARQQYQLFFRDPAGNGVELNFTGETPADAVSHQ